MVAAWSVDRLGRSLQDLVGFLGELHGAGCDLYLDRQGSTRRRQPARLCSRCSGLRRVQRSLIVERVAGSRGRSGRHQERQGVRAAEDQRRARGGCRVPRRQEMGSSKPRGGRDRQRHGRRDQSRNDVKARGRNRNIGAVRFGGDGRHRYIRAGLARAIRRAAEKGRVGRIGVGE